MILTASCQTVNLTGGATLARIYHSQQEYYSFISLIPRIFSVILRSCHGVEHFHHPWPRIKKKKKKNYPASAHSLMPARTFLVAATGAVTGALATALFFSSRAPPSTTFSRPLQPTVATKPDGSEIVDPAGIFQYGW